MPYSTASIQQHGRIEEGEWQSFKTGRKFCLKVFFLCVAVRRLLACLITSVCPSSVKFVILVKAHQLSLVSFPTLTLEKKKGWGVGWGYSEASKHSKKSRMVKELVQGRMSTKILLEQEEDFYF